MGKWLESLKGRRHFAAFLLCLGLVQIAGYWFSGSLVNGSGSLAIPQPDTPLYCQAAARVVEGHPFSYSAGEAVCTGTTSVLYPFLLAIPCWFGFNGPSLVSAGFWLNAVCYLFFLFGWGYFIWRRFSDDLPLRIFSGVMLALFPQTAYCALSQSDIGLWLAVSGMLAAALAAGNALGIGFLLVLAPWVRPEGLICVLSFIAVGCAFAWLRHAQLTKGAFFISLLGVTSVAGVFALNWMLTGRCQFSSVAGKGYFATENFSMAVQRTACDLVIILKGLVLGQANSSPRWFYSIPLLGALLAWTGVFVHEWRRRDVACEFVIVLAALGGILSVAQSGWQNTNVDRYLAWVMPVIVIFTAEGAVWLYRLIRDRSSAALLVPALLLFFSFGSSVVLIVLFNSCSETSECVSAFGRELDTVMPSNASYGVTGWCGLAYSLPNRRCAHVSGIYSPEFTSKKLLGNLEILKREPNTRFDYWIFAGDDKFPEGFKDAQGPQIALGPEGIEVREASWKVFDRAASPHPASAQLLYGKSCRARIDVGYENDERVHAYEIVPRYRLRPYAPIASVLDLNGEKAFDSGCIVFGADEMIVALEPGKDVALVMRTKAKVKFTTSCVSSSQLSLEQEYINPLRLSIAIDGVEACCSSSPIGKEGFTDAVFTIPGNAIKRSPCHVALRGDHVTFGYWFYQ